MCLRQLLPSMLANRGNWGQTTFSRKRISRAETPRRREEAETTGEMHKGYKQQRLGERIALVKWRKSLSSLCASAALREFLSSFPRIRIPPQSSTL